MFPQSPDALRRVLFEVLEAAGNELPGMGVGGLTASAVVAKPA